MPPAPPSAEVGQMVTALADLGRRLRHTADEPTAWVAELRRWCDLEPEHRCVLNQHLSGAVMHPALSYHVAANVTEPLTCRLRRKRTPPNEVTSTIRNALISAMTDTSDTT